MHLRISVTVLALLTAALADGCAGGFPARRLVEPTGPQAQECLDRCTRLSQNCRDRQVYRERECEAQNAAARADYALCIRNRMSDCAEPPACLGADTSICDQEYENCVVACGGRVEKTFSPWSKEKDAPAAPSPGEASPPAAPPTTSPAPAQTQQGVAPAAGSPRG